jgi:hypothetical protein
MPVEVENKLKARARAKGFKGKRFKRYVYGTMNKLGLLASIHPRLVELAAKIDLGDRFEGSAGCCSPCPPERINYPRLYVSGKKEPIDIPKKGKAVVDYKVTNRSMNERDGEERHSIDIEVHSIEPMEPPRRGGEGEAAKPLAQSLLEDVRVLRTFARGDLIGKVGLKSSLPWPKGGVEQTTASMAVRRLRALRKRGEAALIVETLDGPRIMRATAPRKAPRKFSATGRNITLFADPRPRNALGEYTNEPGETVDPNTMAAAYGPPEVSQSHIERIKRFFTGRRKAAAGAIGAGSGYSEN